VTGVALHLLRHGAPVLLGRLMGRTDCEPAEEGIARCVAQAAGVDVERIVTSDLRRARDAAQAIAEERRVAFAIDRRWRELDFGDWDGRAADSVDPDALGRFWQDPDTSPPPNGERWSSLVARLSDAITTLPAQDTLVVTHGGAIRAALHLLCGFEQRQLWAFDLPYGVLVSLRVWPGERPSGRIIGIKP